MRLRWRVFWELFAFSATCSVWGRHRPTTVMTWATMATRHLAARSLRLVVGVYTQRSQTRFPGRMGALYSLTCRLTTKKCMWIHHSIANNSKCCFVASLTYKYISDLMPHHLDWLGLLFSQLWRPKRDLNKIEINVEKSTILFTFTLIHFYIYLLLFTFTPMISSFISCHTSRGCGPGELLFPTMNFLHGELGTEPLWHHIWKLMKKW